ncbi:BspA family leucine-rich repeat surface protein [Flavivirga spongiicola]|uniref:BspA family leucine-rich repeat surface protein n=1 Tax=Flavivirga spongiicola TaxID=421621 RepID=A0ABU7XUK6_9FLAO|nr:BspA family leucine-rich repeat surface protein [Flavivirga sp. MEBiC05379]MDO5979114.1 BspA family leucine-rich repeat surface protein [Flavivirga sp. MEBiC05379]
MIKNIFTILLILFCYNLFGQTFNSIWDTEQSGVSTSNQITIPTNSTYTYNYTVDWGDGLTDTNVAGNITHTYTIPGRYTISISGDFPSIYFNNDGDRNKIIEILAWGSIQWQTMENAFYGCENLNFDAIDNPDLSQVTTLKNMFRDATVFNGIINNWNISTITDISGMFSGAVTFNRPLDNWNTSNVTDMSETFSRAILYNEPLDNWNTALVTNMFGMFRSASAFNQNINNWDVSQVTNMASMFASASSFNQPLNSWNVTGVEDMSNMFSSSDFNQNIENWNVSSVTNMHAMFQRNTDFDQPLNNWDVSHVTNMSNMFDGFYWSAIYNQPLDKWDVSKVTDMSYMFRYNRSFNQPINNWNVSLVTNMRGMFESSGSFNQPLNNWIVSNVTNMSAMFDSAQAFNQPLNNWDVSNVTSMSAMFEYAPIFNQPLDLWDVSGVTNMSTMFQGTKLFNQPIDNWDVSSVTNMRSMFYNALVFNQPLNNWNTSAVTDMSSMFNAYNATTAFNQPLDNWNTSVVNNMSSMFMNASSFDQNLSSWNITNVGNMSNMLSDSGLSQTNYDNTLIGWATQSVQSDVSLGALNLNYCDGRHARQELIDNFNWTINDDIINCPFVICTSLTSPKDGDTNVPANANIVWQAVPGATGYRISVRRVNGGTTQIIYNNEDVGNVTGIDFASDFIPGDEVFVTIVPYNAAGPATGCTEERFTVIPSWVNSPTAFKLTYDTRIAESYTSAANQLEIEINNNFTYNYSIDWGDNQFDNNVTGFITHTYQTPGIYTISIIGNYPAHYFGNYFSDSRKLLTIDQWGTQQWQSMEQAFHYCQNMTYNATDIPDLSQVANMRRMFYSASLFDGNIDSWDVSNVTDMSDMFYSAIAFNQSLNNWDVSNVTNMEQMFIAARSFNQNINAWNVSSVTDMNGMFLYAEVFNQPLNNWNIGAVIDMSRMFRDARAFNQPLNNWDVSSVMDMNEMFRDALVFNQTLNSWDVSKVTDMSFMYYNANSFDQPLNNWNVSSVTTMDSMFYQATVFNQNIDSWNVTNVINMRAMFQEAMAFNQPLNNWDVNSVVNMSSMFESAQVFNQPLRDWNVSAVANMSAMFKNALLFNQPINTWDVSSVTLMNSMFEDAEVFNNPIGNWNVASVTTMEAMFKDAIVFNQPLGSWDTGEALTMAEMFSGASIFNQNIDNWNVSFVTTMEAMFKNAVSYDQPMNSWNVASVKTMKEMFNGASAFNQLIDNWNVRGVTTMEQMFNGATVFNQTINNWRVSGVLNMNSMFMNAMTFNQPFDRWDIGTVSMRSMFNNATSLDQEFSTWNVSRVSDMTNMLDDTALTRENYDTTLIAWSEQVLTPGVTLGALGLLYCDALEERQSMIDTYGWIIVGDILDCPIPGCTQLVAPLNGATDVPVNTNLSWEPTLYARGYRLTVRTNSGNVTIVNNETVTGTSYEFATDFSGGETVFVTLIPFNGEGDAITCTDESFEITSSTVPTVPDCTNLTTPTQAATGIAVNSDLEWLAIANADGYRITVGTSSGNNDIIDNFDVGNITTYDIPTSLPEDTTIFVTITPYNATGDAISCTEEYFTTEIIPVPPICTSLTSPLNGATDVPVNTNLSWDPVSNATGYLLTVGTTGGGIEVLNNVDVGNVTTYNLPDDLKPNRLIFVTITPYNGVGDATSCAEESFRTGNSPAVIPNCTTLSSPLNNATDVSVTTDLSWNAIANATGYSINAGTSIGATDILNAEDVGNVTTYDLVSDLPESTTVYVTITPYNAVGDATSCGEESFTTETLATVPNCTTLSSPLNNATDVSVTTDLSWNAIVNATGYSINAGTSAGATDILNAEDVGNVTTYDLVSDLPESTTVYVTITPYNAVGDATSCGEESFTTETLATVPNCTSLTGPSNGDTGVSVDTDLSWNAIANATGYSINAGTSAGATDILNAEDVGNVTTYDLVSDLPESTRVYVTITPYNAVGDAASCGEESFTTETLATVPNCTTLSSPLNNATDVSVTTDLSWNAIANATGYSINAGTSTGATDILNAEDVGNVTTYDLVSDLPESTTVYVTITPYNAVGDATSCGEESFTTETLATVPNCTTLSSPLNNAADVSVTTDLSWNAIANATGYSINAGTSAGATDLLNNEDVGNVTTYDLVSDLPESTRVYVTITPYNAVGYATGCGEESFTTETLATVPNCTSLTGPSNGETGVAVTTDLSWNAIANATGYSINAGTSTGATDILNAEDVGNVTTYDLVSDLPESTTVYVTITPYNAVGYATSCGEESFTTETLATVPNCTTLSSPLNNATDVSVTTDLSWNAIANATGYSINAGTSAGATDLLNNEDVGNVTTYDLVSDLPESTTVYVTITPYNAIGYATSCGEESFTTETLATVPNCTTLSSPLNNATDVSVTTDLSWNAVANATGYSINAGTSAGATDILNNEDVGNVTTYDLVSDLPESTTVYVSITPYNAVGDATSCSEELFMTEEITEPLVESKYGFSPNGDGINDFWEIKGIENSPQNIVNIYNRWGDLVFSISNYNNTTNRFRGEANNLNKLGASTLPNGTYFFDIKISGTHNLKKLKGFLVIKR